jgi:hypothetical protein
LYPGFTAYLVPLTPVGTLYGVFFFDFKNSFRCKFIVIVDQNLSAVGDISFLLSRGILRNNVLVVLVISLGRSFSSVTNFSIFYATPYLLAGKKL